MTGGQRWPLSSSANVSSSPTIDWHLVGLIDGVLEVDGGSAGDHELYAHFAFNTLFGQVTVAFRYEWRSADGSVHIVTRGAAKGGGSDENCGSGGGDDEDDEDWAGAPHAGLAVRGEVAYDGRDSHSHHHM